jgi:arabinogalactan oligomer/maltooligosaccharide transport system substrate-binding protein
MKERTRDGNYGFVEMYTSSYFMAAWFNAFGGVMIDEKSVPGLDGKGFVDALAYHKAFLPYLDSGGDWTTSTTLFLEGKAASTINGPWFVGNIKAAGIELGLASLPVVSPINKPLAPYAGVQGVHLVKAGKHKEAAIQVIRFLQQPDVGQALGEVLGCAPAHRKAYDSGTIRQSAIIPVLRSVADAAVPMPKVPAMDIMWRATDDALLAIAKKGGDVTAELEKAQAWAIGRIAEMGQ